MRISKADFDRAVSREYKGTSLFCFPLDCVVFDIETTGLSETCDEITEIGALRIRDGKVVDEFAQLVKPEKEISAYITRLTGISNEMVKDAPSIAQVLPKFLDFVGEDIVVGHNVNFDINFIYFNTEIHLGIPFTNNYVDTMVLSRKLLPKLEHHRLCDLVEYYHVNNKNAHRALSDCMATYECLMKMKNNLHN